MKRQFVKAASTPQMIDAFEAKLAEMQSPVESSTDWATDLHNTIQSLPEEERYFESNADYLQDEMDRAGGYRNYIHNERKRNSLYSSTDIKAADDSFVELQIYGDDGYHYYEDINGIYSGVPGAMITVAELKNFWNDFYDDDPVLSGEYRPDEGQQWLADTLGYMKEVDASTALHTEEVDEDLEPVKGEQQWGDDQVFMLMDYTGGTEGMESDTFDCIGKFFAVDEADAKRQLERAKRYSSRLKWLDNPYVTSFNEYFDNGDEVYTDLDTLLDRETISPNDVDGNMPEEPVFESTEIELEEDLEACGDVPVEGSLFGDFYFGKEQAEKYGDLICQNLSGQTVSKRQDLAEQPGGLIYEANMLGIDMWDLLEALEGLCYQGKAVEIDDSTYRIN